VRIGLATLGLAVAACAHRAPAGAWLERDTRGESHASGPAGEPDAVAALDPKTLSAAAIDQLDEATAIATLGRAGDAAPAARLALRAARLAYHRGDDPAARALLARAATAADEPELHAELIELGARIAAPPPVDARTIAVLLPLSGKYAAIGAELKAAVQLAPAEGTAWLFLDTKGDADGAVAAVEAAAAKGVAGILGPVGERESIAAARAAVRLGLPIGLLAPADGADPAAGVFRLVESPADEGRAVARLAASDSFPTVAVFAPRDDIGAESAAAFVAEAKRLGLAVTGEGTYDPTGGNLEPDVKQFLNLIPATNERLAKHLRRGGKRAWATFSPDIAYSLLYIPDRHDRGALVASFLPYFNVEVRTNDFPDIAMLQRKHGGHTPQVVQLVGGAGWHHPTLPIRGGAAVQGALIVDAYAGDLGGDAGATFAQDFTLRTKRSASAAAAQVHDAAALVARARRLAATSHDVRRALTTALAHGAIDDGACGPAAIGPDGEIARAAAVLEVQGDTLVLAP
jgi:ABC-type branched-subunit amino acid transport system substrate-binding protein